MGTLKIPVAELGAVIRNSFISELESLKSYGCTVSYTERKGFFFTYLSNVVVTGPDHVLEWFVARIKEYER